VLRLLGIVGIGPQVLVLCRRPWLVGDLSVLGIDDSAWTRFSHLAPSRLRHFFDADFFAYREDADVAWRAQLLGWRCIYTPAAVGWHVRSVVPGKRRSITPSIKMHSVTNRFLMRIKNASESLFHDIGLGRGVKGIVYTGTRCFSNVFERIFSVGPPGAVYGISMEAHTGGGQHSFRECSLGGNTGFSLGTDTVTDSIAFYNCNFEQCLVNSFYCGGMVRGLGFYSCRNEGCDTVDFQINPVAGKSVWGLVIAGCFFDASDSGGADRIAIGGAGGVVRGFSITANMVDHGANNFSASLVRLNGEGESGIIANNFLNGLKANCHPVNVLRTNVSVYNNEANDGKFTGTLSIV
jgi:hypothetical protein